jgi:FtsP/CotA-like multicopper oxidase with cupredoxin domain
MKRRDLLKLGMMSGAAALVGSQVARPGRAHAALYTEAFPASPLILEPFTDPLPVPTPLAPVDPNTLSPKPEYVRNDFFNDHSHQVIPSDLGLPEPIYYRIKLEVGQHRFSTSPVEVRVPYVRNGQVVPAGTRVLDGTVLRLPPSTIYGFNGAFPGAMVKTSYGQPVVIRFENHLDENPNNYPRLDFGDPNFKFLTHLHNGHTAPESDGNPHHMHHNGGGYLPGQWVDNLYLNWPAGNDPREKQSFLWFHDHTHGHTGANVYKGMVGLYPIYDPQLDPGDETKGLRLPGVPDPATGGVKYDIPLAFYDVAFDDGATLHHDAHDPVNGTGVHPEWWGMHYFRHFPNHGFVGDVMTVNCVAYPVLHVKRRKYRFRMLSASIARCYNVTLMSSTSGPTQIPIDPVTAKPERRGQWELLDGQQCMRMTQIATDGGLLPFPVTRDMIEVWPGKRREIVVDFSKYMDGSPTSINDEIYLVNTMEMEDGRKPEFDNPSDYKVPLMKFVIDGNPPEPDRSLIPAKMRPLCPLPPFNGNPDREFELIRGGGNTDPETEWSIKYLNENRTLNFETPESGFAFSVSRRSPGEFWALSTGGGWTHPMHFHQEEHRVVRREGSSEETADPNRHRDDMGREDLIALDPGETVTMFRKFRTFTGKYVAHCHNLAHEDHSMMFGFTIID